MKIDQLLTEWRNLNYKPTYQELLEVQAEQQALLTALAEMVNEPQPAGIDRAVYQKALELVIEHGGVAA